MNKPIDHDNRTLIDFDVPKLNRFKKDYKKAVERGRDRFLFEENIFLTAYAKYLIEYLDNEFKQRRRKR